MLLESEISISRIETGVQTNCFVRYATSLDPFQWSANGGLDPGQYMGFAVVSGETAPTDPKDYSFAPVAGDAGRSVESVSEEYYLSTSSDSLTGGSWSSSYPSYVEGTYLWTRMKVTYSNPSGTSYGTPVLDAVWSEISGLQNSVQTLQTDFTVEQGKVNTFISETNTTLSNTSSQINNIQSTVNGTTQTISSLQTTVNTHGTDIAEIQSNITEINATAEGISTMVTAAQSTAEAASSTATQNADKIGWLVKSGSNASNFELTDRAIELVSENINLTGKVTFNSLDTATQDKLNNALTEARVEYAQSTSSTQAPQFGWSETCPTKETGKYIWQRTITIDTQNNEVVSTPVCISGKDGEDAIVLSIESSNGYIFKNSAINTVLTVTIYYGNNTITDSTFFHTIFGPDAYLTWYQKPYGSDTFSAIPSNDPRLSDEGFMLTVSANDVFNKCTFECEFSDS